MQTEIKEKNCPNRRGIFRVLLATTALIAAGIAVGTLTGRQPLMLTATAFAGVLGLWLALARPDVALTLLFCGEVMITEGTPDGLIDFFCIYDVDIIQGLPSASITVFLILFCVTMARTLFIEKRPLPVSLRGLGIYTVVLFLALLTGLFRNCDRVMLRVDFMGMLFPVLCFYLCITILNSRKRIERLLLALLMVSALKACILYAFYLAGRGWPYATYRVATLDSADLLVFITLVLIAVHLLVRRDVRGFRAVLVSAACIPMLLVIIFAYRRSQWVGMIFSLGLLYLGAAKLIRHRIAIVLVIALCAASAFAVLAGLSEEKSTRIASRLTSIFDKKQDSNAYHLLESKQVLRDLSRSPLFGLGMGSYHSPLGLYEEDTVPANVVHNTYLYIWMKMGLPGLLFFIWIAVLYARQILRVHKKNLHDEVLGLFLPLAASSGLWLTMFLVGPVPWYLHITFLMALFSAMTMSLVLQADRASQLQPGVQS